MLVIKHSMESHTTTTRLPIIHRITSRSMHRLCQDCNQAINNTDTIHNTPTLDIIVTTPITQPYAESAQCPSATNTTTCIIIHNNQHTRMPRQSQMTIVSWETSAQYRNTCTYMVQLPPAVYGHITKVNGHTSDQFRFSIDQHTAQGKN